MFWKDVPLGKEVIKIIRAHHKLRCFCARIRKHQYTKPALPEQERFSAIDTKGMLLFNDNKIEVIDWHIDIWLLQSKVMLHLKYKNLQLCHSGTLQHQINKLRINPNS